MSTRKGLVFVKRIKLETVVLVLSVIIALITVCVYIAGNRPGVTLIETKRTREVIAESEQEVVTTHVVDLNEATQSEFETLPGIGPAISERIVAYREENGPFLTVEDILNVSGIGEKKLDAIRDYIIVR